MRRKGISKFGIAFWERLEWGKRRRNLVSTGELLRAASWGDPEKTEPKKQKNKAVLSNWRLVPVYVVFSAFLIILLGRAFELQVIRGGVFLGEAQENHVRVQVNHAPRGVIFDRNGKVLAQNKPGFRLFIEPKAVSEDKEKQILEIISEILEIPYEEISEKIGSGEEQITLSAQLSAQKALIIESKENSLPGVVLEVNPIRDYPYKDTVSHVIGYTTEADEKDLARNIEPPYELGDKVGKDGVEASFEDILRGTNGYILTNVSAQGEVKGEFFKKDPRAGNDITLSIDIELQEFVYNTLRKKIKAIGAKAASAVVTNPKTGEILALVSLPSYNNNIFSQLLTQASFENLVENKNKPLLNRVIGASYPPGSTFKIVTATAGLELGAIKPDTRIEDTGFITLGDQVFNNWLWLDSRRKEGSINVVRALARSTDTFFYRLGQMIGEKEIEKYSLVFGLGSKTGIELPAESAGLIPNEEWKLKNKGEVWFPGETLNISIGQGDLLLSPIQLSTVISVFANGGRLIVPTVLKTDNPNVKKDDFLGKETLKTIQQGLYANTVGDGNVGWLFSDFKIKTAGKTGTAESGKEIPHAWYTGYAPYPQGKIVVTVQIENAGHGSEESAPVVKEIFKWWFNKRN